MYCFELFRDGVEFFEIGIIVWYEVFFQVCEQKETGVNEEDEKYHKNVYGHGFFVDATIRVLFNFGVVLNLFG